MNNLQCGLPYDDFMHLVTATPLNRLSLDEAKKIFEKLAELGFRVTPAEQ